MLEIPESIIIANQLNTTLIGKTITQVIVNASPHKFVFFHKDPTAYPDLLIGKKIGKATGLGASVEIESEVYRITFGDGTNLRYYPKIADVPPKHQFFLGFSDGSALAVTIQMYGFIAVFKDGENQNPYYLATKTKPSPLSETFTLDYFLNLIQDTPAKLSVKALLATAQRIPGLGNGVLQDILFDAKLSPRIKLSTLSEDQIKQLYASVRLILKAMTDQGGRDTEKDLFGKEGGYPTVMSGKHLGEPCPNCGTPILKESYMGGSVYTCPHCQPNEKA